MTRTAKTVVIDTTGGPDVLRIKERAVGEPGPGEVRIVHKAIGVNFIDIYHRSGLYPLEYPAALGMEAAGIVDAAGAGVTHLKPGDRAAYAAMPAGAYSELRVMPAAQICPLPDMISFEDGAAMMLKGLTTQYLFHRTVPLAKGDVVLFHAAAGGVGLIACQWAKSEGIILIGTAGTDEKCQMALAHGASHCINYRSENFSEKVRELTDGKGVNAVMDAVGADTFEDSLDCLKPLGMMISFGNASGPVPPFDLAILGRKGSLKITRPTLFAHIAEHATCQAMARQLFEKVASGEVRTHIGQRFPLDRVAEAHRALEARETTGATILLP